MYDDRGQLVTTILPDATPNNDSDNLRTITLYDRGGRTRASINEAGQVSHSVYDSVGRMVATIVPDGTDTLTDLFALLKASTESLYGPIEGLLSYSAIRLKALRINTSRNAIL